MTTTDHWSLVPGGEAAIVGCGCGAARRLGSNCPTGSRRARRCAALHRRSLRLDLSACAATWCRWTVTQPIPTNPVPDPTGANWADSSGRRNARSREVAMGTPKRRRSDRAGRPLMRSPSRPPGWRREHRQRFWAAIARGATSEAAGVEAGVSPAVGVRWFGITTQLATDRRRRAAELPRDLPNPAPGGPQQSDLLPLGKRQVASRQRRLLSGAVERPDGVAVEGPEVTWIGRRHGRRQDRRRAKSWSPEQISSRLVSISLMMSRCGFRTRRSTSRCMREEARPV